MPQRDNVTVIAKRHRQRADSAGIEAFRAHIGELGPFTPQSAGHWTTTDQLEALAQAAGADPTIGYLMRAAALCSLPRTNPGTADRYVRRNGPFALVMIAGGERPRLPYGNLPRLILAWMATEATRTQHRWLKLGHTFNDFMRELGIANTSGGPRGDRTRLQEQLTRLLTCSVELTHATKDGIIRVADHITTESRLWWSPKDPDQPALWGESCIELGPKFYEEIIHCPVPIDIAVLRAMRRSPLGLDIYSWLTYRLFTLGERLRLPWPQIYRQFGPHPGNATRSAVNNFRMDFVRELQKLRTAWPEFRYSLPTGALELRPTKPRIHPSQPPPIRER